MSTQVKHRGWVKNAAIIFLAVMLVLTFFSNTILNYSLPEVAAQYAQSGTITSKVKANAPIEANMTFNVEMAETRQIESVKVKVGDMIEAGDILLYLADEESAELKAAQAELAALELAYEKALLQLEDPNYAADNLQIKELKEDIAEKKAERGTVANKEAAVEAAKLAVRNAEDAVDALNEQKAEIDEAIAELSGDDSLIGQFKAALDAAEKNLAKAQEVLAELQGQGGDYDSAKKAYDNAVTTLANLETDLTHLKEDLWLTLQDIGTSLSLGMDPTNPSVEDAMKTINSYLGLNDSSTILETQHALENKYAELTLVGVPNLVTAERSIQARQAEVLAAQAAKDAAKATLDATQNTTSQVSAAQANVDYWQQQKEMAQAHYDTALSNTTSTLKAQLSGINDQLKAANRALEDANDHLSKVQSESSTTVEAIDEEIKSLQRQLESLYIALGEKTDGDKVSSALANLDLEAQRREIDDKKAEIEKLAARGTGATVTSQYGGMVSSLSCVAGDTVSTGSIVAVIEVVEKGYRMEFSVTNDQAKLIKVGDKAKINDWWYSDADITVVSIRNDPQNPGQGKRVTCTIAGEVTVGQVLNIELGERGMNYDIIVPNSAIREDSNGKFVLVVEARATPLSTRYIATRYDVTVVASDDTRSAISGALYGSEFVITTSTKPIVAGQQVRLLEN